LKPSQKSQTETNRSKALSAIKAELIKRGVYKPAKPQDAEPDEPEPEIIPPGPEWVKKHFPEVATAPFGDRQLQLWRWGESLELGVHQYPFGAIWPRGSAKSKTVELLCTYLERTRRRKFVLYVSGTQEQANDHVDAIGHQFEELGVGHLVSKHGHSRGWKSSKVRTETGFSVVAVGLDKSVRGIKLDHMRPDLIVLDDIDDDEDSKETVKKKIKRITRSILPSGSKDCSVIFVQNLIHENGVMAQLVDHRADFLHDIDIDGPHVAVEGLQVERVVNERGHRVYKIVSGRATWEGQSIDICEWQINDWGYQTFLREAQHEVKGVGGIFFQTDAIHIIDSLADIKLSDDAPVPKMVKLVVPNDFAATEGAGDYSVHMLMGATSNGAVVVFDMWHEQRSSDKVRKALMQNCRYWKSYGTFTVLLPDDPGAAGTAMAEQLASRLRSPGHYQENRLAKECLLALRDKVPHGLCDKLLEPIDDERRLALVSDLADLLPAMSNDDKALALRGLIATCREDDIWVIGGESWAFDVKIIPVSGKKATRARTSQEKINGGDVYLMRGSWNAEFIDEHRLFREDESHDHDDIVDAMSDGINELELSGWTSTAAGMEELAKILSSM
jgi:hypothetical protein